MNLQDQQTVIQFSRDSETATIWTSDRTVMTRLDKFVKDGKNSSWRLKEESRLLDGELASKTYETNKRLISFRANIGKRELTDEQKQAAAERMRNIRKKEAD